jgi:hypothetical protein
MIIENPQKQRATGGWQDVLCAQLDNARGIRLGGGQDRAKIQVMGEHDVLVGFRPVKDFVICRCWRADGRPVNRVMTTLPKSGNPKRRDAARRAFDTITGSLRVVCSEFCSL